MYQQVTDQDIKRKQLTKGNKERERFQHTICCIFEEKEGQNASPSYESKLLVIVVIRLTCSPLRERNNKGVCNIWRPWKLIRLIAVQNFNQPQNYGPIINLQEDGNQLIQEHATQADVLFWKHCQELTTTNLLGRSGRIIEPKKNLKELANYVLSKNSFSDRKLDTDSRWCDSHCLFLYIKKKIPTPKALLLLSYFLKPLQINKVLSIWEKEICLLEKFAGFKFACLLLLVWAELGTIGPWSWVYGHPCARSTLTRPWANIVLIQWAISVWLCH